MPSTVALLTGLTGLSSHARRLDVIGNNIANVNTVGYKSSRMTFSAAFTQNFSLGTQPGTSTGGTNPTQIGLGVSIAGTQRNFNNGSIGATGVPTDVAIEGDGFFIVEFGGERIFTRDGSFQLNENNDLTNLTGGNVMGYTIDNEFDILDGNLVPLNIPVGIMTITEATNNVIFSGNLNASGQIASTGSTHETRAFYTDSALTTLLNTGSFDLTTPGNDLYIDDGAGGSFLAFEGGAGTIITISGIEKGGKDLGEHSFAFSNTAVAGTDDFGATIDDFIDFLNDVLGLDSTVIDGQTLGGGATFDVATGQIMITGNEGEDQQLTIESANLVASNAGAGISQPFVMTQTGEADGESVRTSFVVYDSLGTPLTVDLTFVLQETTPGEGTTWQFIAESSDNDALSRIVGLGVVEFDHNGDFVEASNQAFSLTRDNGAVSPLTVSMNFDSGTDAITALTDTNSQMAAVFQDGSPIGTLSAFSIGNDGVVTGSFTNGLTRTLGQIALAKFANPAGLIDVGSNYFQVGPNSGPAIITSPLGFGTGRVVGGALELSNVDLSEEFINLILTSTGYSASSRIITTTDELIDQLLLLGR